MAKRKLTEQPSEATVAPINFEPAKSDLPQIESPSISPAEPAPTAEPVTTPTPVIETAASPEPKPFFAKPAFLKMKLTPHNKRVAVLAASVALAALFGAAAGAIGTNASLAAKKPPVEVAAIDERKAMQQSIAHLSKEVASLKTNLEAASKTAQNLAAKTADRLAAMAEITGSISSPQTLPAAGAQTTPMPPPRPAQEALAPPPMRPAVVLPDWTIRMARDGMALVQGHGELYQAVLGAPLPGLGPVQTIKREDGRWVVVTPRGIIVSSRDRHYFE
jgi:hypothetical protein